MFAKLFATLILIFAPLIAAAEVRVIDGDTIEIDGTHYRINGIDAPEHGQKCGGWSCGKDATDALIALVKNQDIVCQTIANDGYGREIATCYAGDIDIGRAMVEAGHAWAFLKYSRVYASEELDAKAKSLGIWSGNFEPAWDYRARRWQSAEQIAPQGCPIKGNITKSGRIYHAPWSPWYAKTRIDISKGERWFCSEAEAIEAGWRAPYWN